MNRTRGSVLGLAMLVATAMPAAGQGGGAAPATSVTLFNSGRVLVRRTLPVAVLSGEGTYTIAIGEFNPATFAALDPGVQLVSVKSDQILSEATLLRKYVGRVFEIDTSQSGRSGAPTRRATLLSMDPERWEWVDRPGVMFLRPGRVVWARDMVPSVKTADVELQSDRARQNIHVMYETSGSSWAASYRLFVGTAGRLEGVASIGSGVLQFPDAEVQLLSGDIGRGTPPQMQTAGQIAFAGRGGLVARDEPATLAANVNGFEEASMAVSSAIGEAHLYTLPQHVSLTPGNVLAVPLFAPVAANAERRYVVAGSLPYYGGIGQQQEEMSVPVSISYHLDRKPGTPFGDLPLPGGYVGVFDLDKNGRVQLVGQGNIGHTAPGAEMVVDAGSAFDITAKRTQTDYTTTRTGGNGVPVRTAAIAAYRVTLQNAKDSAVTVEVREDRGGEWSVLDSSVPPIKRSATRTVFMVAIPARGTATLTYRVRVVW